MNGYTGLEEVVHEYTKGMEFRYRLKTKRIKTEEDLNQIQPFIENKSTADATTFSSSSSSESIKQITNQNSSSPTMPSKFKENNWKKDKFNICILLFLYLLQGIPLGMAASIPLIIQTYGTTWSQQATFSFAFWPFSLKLLWAPIVDSLYIKKFGRRKSWLIPIQYLIGICMIILSYYINDILLTTKASINNQPHIYFLTSIFFGLSFLAATQDICVDGWALSMLSRENVGWASICNSVGQTAGYFLGNVVFLALESKDFANRYIRQPLHIELKSTGLITLPGFLLFWGITFAISTTIVAIIKHETDESYDSNEPHFGLIKTYKLLWKVLCLSSVRSIAFILLTVKIGFAAVDAMTGLELIERGVTKDSLALLAIPLTPLQILLPFIISKYTTGSKPLNIYIKSYPFRLLLGVFMAIFVYYTPAFQNLDKTFPWYYYALAVFIYSIHQVFVYNMFVSQMAFFAQISDPKIGGTYMTLLNTFANLGSTGMSTVVLYAGDYLQWKRCSLNQLQCDRELDEKSCTTLGGVCRPYIDAYYVEVILCTIAGVFWIIWKYQKILDLQNLQMSRWQVRKYRQKSQFSDDEDTPTLILTA